MKRIAGLILCMGLIGILYSCKTGEKSTSSGEVPKIVEENCLHYGQVVDMRSRLGCGYLIYSESGRVFQVVNWDESKWHPAALDRIYFDYEISREGGGLLVGGPTFLFA